MSNLPSGENQQLSAGVAEVDTTEKPSKEPRKPFWSPRDWIGLVIVIGSLITFGILLTLAAVRVNTFDDALKLLTTVMATVSGWIGAVIALYAPKGKGEE